MTIPVIDWPYCTNNVVFRPNYQTAPPEFGRQQHNVMSPFWLCDLVMPSKGLDAYRKIEALLAEIEGFGIVNVYDPRFPLPGYWRRETHHNHVLADRIPEVFINAMDRASKTITITGSATDDDRITKGDPLAFTYDDRRYYFKAAEDLIIDGTAQTLPVYLRPRETVTGLSVKVDRIRPTMRFAINHNNTHSPTVSGQTVFTIQGVEFWHKAPGLA